MNPGDLVIMDVDYFNLPALGFVELPSSQAQNIFGWGAQGDNTDRVRLNKRVPGIVLGQVMTYRRFTLVVMDEVLAWFPTDWLNLLHS